MSNFNYTLSRLHGLECEDINEASICDGSFARRSLLKMVSKMLHVCYVLGMFPLRFHRKGVAVSKFGLFANVCSVLILISYVVKLSYHIGYKLQNRLAFTSLKFLIQIANSLLLLVILARRNANASSEAKILSKLFASDSCKVNLIFGVGFCGVLAESALFAHFRSANDDFFLYDFTLVLRVAFEFQIILILACEERLYENLNYSFRTSFVNDAAAVLGYRKKYENLHDLRSSTNELFSFDMLIYFSSSFQCMLLVSFEVTEFFSYDKESHSTNAIILEGLRFSRLLMCMSYLIWMWEKVSKKSTDALKLSFQNEIEKLPHSVTHQIMMFTDDILLRNKLFNANKYFDINMSLLYNISGTIFAYFTLIITSTISQQRVVQS